MPGQHTEQAFETAIEEYLITHGGYRQGDPAAFDLDRGLFSGDVLAFIKKSQPKEWAYLEGIRKNKVKTTLLAKLSKGDRGSVYNFEDDIALKYYRLQKISEGSIQLEAGKKFPVYLPVGYMRVLWYPVSVENYRRFQ